MDVAAVLARKGCSVISVPPDANVGRVCALLVRRRIGAVIVGDAACELHGILTERDIMEGLVEYGPAALDMRADALMTRDVQAVTGGTSVEEALEIMDAGPFRHLPVVRGGRLCGIVSVRDLVRFRRLRETPPLPPRPLRVAGLRRA